MSEVVRDPAPEAEVRALLEQGRLDAADQLCSKLAKRGVSAALAPAMLMLAQACHAAGRQAVAAAWLRRMANAAPNAQDLEAARLALALERPQVASLLFEKADKHRALAATDRLHMAQATLKAAELLRLPHGRHGAWAQHEEMLQKAERLFEAMVKAGEATVAEKAEAWTGLARALRLQRADAARIELALASAAALLIALNSRSVPEPGA